MAIGLFMLMKDDSKKKMASLIVAANKPPQASEVENVESDNSMAEDSAAEDLISAIEQKSAKGVVEAMKALIEILDTANEPELEIESENEQ